MHRETDWKTRLIYWGNKITIVFFLFSIFSKFFGKIHFVTGKKTFLTVAYSRILCIYFKSILEDYSMWENVHSILLNKNNTLEILHSVKKLWDNINLKGFISG